MTRSPSVELPAAVKPRLLVAPPRSGSAGSEAVDLAASAGLRLHAWQALALEESCGEVDGRWAAFEVAVVAPRQNGKGSILEARVLAGLFLFGERLIIWSAHEFKTAKEAYLRLRNLVESTPHLHARVAKYYQSNETTEIVLKSGARVKFLARNNTSGRGFTGDLVILDEAFALTPDTMAAILPTMAARSIRGNPQLWYTSSAGMRSSVHLRAVRKRALSDEPGSLCWLEWSAPIEARDSPEDRAWWFMANPSLGLEISVEFVQAEFDAMRATALEQFCRERLGLFDDLDEPDAAFTAGRWEAVRSRDEFDGPVWFAVEVSPDRGFTSIAAGDAGGLVELGEYRPGTGWAVERLVELCAKNRAPVVLRKSGPAGSLVADLEAAGLTVHAWGLDEVRAACGRFFDAVEGGLVRVRVHPQADAAVAVATKRPSGDAWLWECRSGTNDVSPLMALTLAFHAPAVVATGLDWTFIDV